MLRFSAGLREFSPPKRPDRLWGTLSLLVSVGQSLGVKLLGRNLCILRHKILPQTETCKWKDLGSGVRSQCLFSHYIAGLVLPAQWPTEGVVWGVQTPSPPKFRRYRWSTRSHEQKEPATRFPFVIHCVLIRL